MAAVSDLVEVAPDGHDLGLAIPSVFVWKSDRPGASPNRVPELTIHGDAGLHVRLGGVGDARDIGVTPPPTTDGTPDTDLDGLRVERLALETELPELHERLATLRGELARLKQEIRTAQRERDEARLVTTALLEQAADLSGDAPELGRDPGTPRTARPGSVVDGDRGPALRGPASLLRIPSDVLRFATRGAPRRFDDS